SQTPQPNTTAKHHSQTPQLNTTAKTVGWISNEYCILVYRMHLVVYYCPSGIIIYSVNTR
ncbi:hypothetical protein, partial [Photobacterium phosphoreum]|uniref:hypothetical protein n=1 Tax=Photobacterium phosphoreum TaxID=659 RepID=UPI001E284504